MNAQRGGPRFSWVVLLAAAVAIVVVATLTTWWALLALVPLTMMLGCLTMMASHGRMPCAPSVGRGCCAVSALSFRPDEEEREEPTAPAAS